MMPWRFYFNCQLPAISKKVVLSSLVLLHVPNGGLCNTNAFPLVCNLRELIESLKNPQLRPCENGETSSSVAKHIFNMKASRESRLE